MIADLLRAATGDRRLAVARGLLRELEPGRRAVAAELARDRPAGLAALDDLATRAHGLYRERWRAAAASGAGLSRPLARARVAIDDLLATDEVELMDRDDLPEATRREIMESLARFNRLVLAYRRFVSLAAPLVEAAAARAAGAPVRVLELASGHGDLAFHLDGWARERGLAVEVTGSDFAPVYVDVGNRKARERGATVRYVEIDALDIAMPDASVDLVLMTQSLHHFSPGRLARLFAEAGRVGRAALLVDGWRSLALLLGLGTLFAAFFPSASRHDAVISMRRFYSAAELTLLAGLGPRGDRARVAFAPPGYAAVTLDAP